MGGGNLKVLVLLLWVLYGGSALGKAALSPGSPSTPIENELGLVTQQSASADQLTSGVTVTGLSGVKEVIGTILLMSLRTWSVLQ